MSITFRETARQHPRLFLLLLAGALWFGWKTVVATYELLNDFSLTLFMHLDASYGQLGGWPGYGLLGLGLGAAAGAIAAQRRFRLSRRIVLGAGLLGALLLMAGYFSGNRVAYTAQPEIDAPMDNNTMSAGAVLESTQPAAVAPSPALPDTTHPAPQAASAVAAATLSPTVEADAWLQAGEALSLWASPADSAEPASLQLQAQEVVHVVRRAGLWAEVLTGGRNRSPQDPTGWVRAGGLVPLPAEAAEANKQPPSPNPPDADARAANSENAGGNGIGPPASRRYPAANAPAGPEKEAIPTGGWPTGHQQRTGHVGSLALTLSLDWQPNGELSGSCYYDQQPGTRYRLTGALKASGELSLLVFTRGQQSARCVLQRQDAGYAGTMYTADGQELAMNFE